MARGAQSERASWKQQPSEARGPESRYQRRQEVSGASVSLPSQARARRPREGWAAGGWQRQRLKPELPRFPPTPPRLAVTQCCSKRLSQGPISSAQGWRQGVQGAGVTTRENQADPSGPLSLLSAKEGQVQPPRSGAGGDSVGSWERAQLRAWHTGDLHTGARDNGAGAPWVRAAENEVQRSGSVQWPWQEKGGRARGQLEHLPDRLRNDSVSSDPLYFGF